MATESILTAVTDTAFSIWFLIGAALVFFMQAGFAMVETGFTRAKNAGNIIMKNLMDFCIGTVVFALLGFSLMMGENYIFGFIGLPDFSLFTDFGTFIETNASSFVFNLVFCATAATIVSGAMAERTKFLSYCIYSAVISLVVYPVEAGWIWNSQGWLNRLGFIDYAGSTAIHMVGGIAALVGAAILGPRLGKYSRDSSGKVKKVNAIPGHAITIGALGVFILWFGWYGFSGIGSLEEYFAYDPDEYYASLQMGLPALYYSGRENPPHPEIWINYFLRMVELYSKKVCELSVSAATDELETALSHLNAKEKEFLSYLIKNRLFEFTPIEVSKTLGVTNKTIINRCAKLTANGFLIPNIVKERVRSYSLSEFSKANEKRFL